MTKTRTRFQAIGTQWDIQLHDEVSDKAWLDLLQKIYLRIQSFDKAYSRFRPDSLVTQIAKAGGKHELPADGFKLMQFYEQLYSLTEGQVTPLIGQIVSDAGYDAEYSFQTRELSKPPKWEDVITYTKHTLTVAQPVLLDFGAAGKGYLVDIVAELIEQAGYHSFTVNAGGDILHRSADSEKLEVGLENPHDTSEAIGLVRVGNQSLCASAGSKRAWGKFHHIINPASLQSPQDVIATWVLADDTMTADGLATALFFTSPETLSQQFSFSYAVLGNDMALTYDKNFPITVFTAE